MSIMNRLIFVLLFAVSVFEVNNTACLCKTNNNTSEQGYLERMKLAKSTKE